MATKEQVQEALNLHEQGMETPDMAVIISSIVPCDMCTNPVALVDGKTKAGPWANMCASCFFRHGVGLGVGKGQVLIWKAEVQED